jgi:hypothetical protein
MILYESELWMNGDTLLRRVEVRAVAGSDGLLRRLDQDFEPSHQAVRLLRATVTPPSGQAVEVPPWAVDTLHGESGYPRRLSVAFPGAVPGSLVEYSLLRKDWSRLYEHGPWLVLEPRAVKVDTVRVHVRHSPGELSWQGEGYSADTLDDGILLSAEDPQEKLWVTSVASWAALGDVLLRDAQSASQPPFPPDLRAAALQASTFGPDPRSMVMKARTLLTESFQPDLDLSPLSALTVRPLQAVLDSRRAIPLEMAVVMSSICTELGLDSRILPARDARPALPVPRGWDRMLVRVDGGEGREILVEPSAYLTQADYVHRPSRLWLLDVERGDLVSMEPNPGYESRCAEDWRIDHERGTFELRLACSGYFDMVLRRKLAGLEPEEAVIAMAIWIWHSGSVVAVESLERSDLFDLSEPARVEARGSLAISNAPYLTAPGLDWGEIGEMQHQFKRSWILPSAPEGISVQGFSIGRTDLGETVLVDSCPRPRTVLMRF